MKGSGRSAVGAVRSRSLSAQSARYTAALIRKEERHLVIEQLREALQRWYEGDDDESLDLFDLLDRIEKE